MTITPQDTRKFEVQTLPTLGRPQERRSEQAISALPLQGQESAQLPKNKLEKLARDLVGQTFFGTLLKQMHDSPFKSDLFGGGRGEQAFSPLYDQHLAQRMTRGAGDKLVRPIVKKFQKAAEDAYRKQKEKDLVSTYRRA
jgi:Rod binding domain-containing protein